MAPSIRSQLALAQAPASAFRLAAENWAFRTQFEREASAHFESIAAALNARGTSSAVVDLAWQAVAEERRHAVLCAELATSLGAQVASASRKPDPATVSAVSVVAMCCVTESLSAALLLAMHRAADHSRVKRVVHEVLRDEINHSRIGWAVLAEGLEPEERRQLAADLPGILADTVAEELFWPSDGLPCAERERARGLGVLPRTQRREVFCDTMRVVVFPGLQLFDIDTSRAESWLNVRVPIPQTRAQSIQ